MKQKQNWFNQKRRKEITLRCPTIPFSRCLCICFCCWLLLYLLLVYSFVWRWRILNWCKWNFEEANKSEREREQQQKQQQKKQANDTVSHNSVYNTYKILWIVIAAAAPSKWRHSILIHNITCKQVKSN